MVLLPRAACALLLAAGSAALPKHFVRAALTRVLYAAGVCMTLGLSTNRHTAPFWNRTVEPVFVDLLSDVTYAVHEGLVKGLRSDGDDVKA